MSIEKNNETINGNFKGKNILSLNQFTPQDIGIVFQEAPRMRAAVENRQQLIDLKGQVVTLLFYEPSSRTYGSFTSAIQRLDGGIIPVHNPETTTSIAKGETLEDTIKTFECWSDGIVIRSRMPGDAVRAADAALYIPVFNAGDGIGEHPTQSLYDLYTLQEQFNRLNHLTGVIVGDLLNGRTIHSLVKGLSLYRGNTVYSLAPERLRLPQNEITELTQRGMKFIEIDTVNDIPAQADFWYWTRVQKERFSSSEEYEQVKYQFVLTPKLVQAYGNKHMIIMHPLPRAGEIELGVDTDPRSVYLRRQMRNGLYIRMALLSLVMGK